MSNQSKTQVAAKTAAKEDAKDTGAAGIPNTQPATPGRAKLSDAERAVRATARLADHERLLEQRTDDVHKFMVGLESSSLAQRIRDYDDVDEDYIEACLQRIDADVTLLRAAQKARTTAKPAGEKTASLKEMAAKLKAQRAGVPIGTSVGPANNQ